MKYLFYIGWIILIAACSQSGSNSVTTSEVVTDSVRYARGFIIHREKEYTLAEIKDPWNPGNILQRYILVDREKPIPANLPKGTIVRVPVRNVVVYTSVHASVIDQLNESDKIIGVCEPHYIDIPEVQEGLASGKVADLGMATSPNVERIMDIGAEIIIASPFQNSNYGQAEKLGIPIIEGADYMEAHPLGRAEWGRFYGLLFNKAAQADSIFNGTETRYMEMAQLAATANHKPTVFSERKYGQFWYIPCGESYTAQFFKDAGAEYIFKDLPGSGSKPMAFESVLEKAIHADIWLIKYNLTEEMSYKGLRTEYTPYENFDAYKSRRIFTCNTGKVPYYEEFPIHPDYLLKDMIKIFHPELLPDYTCRYYQPMTDL